MKYNNIPFAAVASVFVLTFILVFGNGLSALEHNHEHSHAAVTKALTSKTQKIAPIKKNNTQLSKKEEEKQKISQASATYVAEFNKDLILISKRDKKKEKKVDVKTLSEKAGNRKSFAKELMKSNPALFNNLLAIKKVDRDVLPSEVQKNIEEFTTITGKTEVIHVDDFKNTENSYFKYYLKTPKKRYSFYPSSSIPLSSNKTVSITGYVLDDQISVDTDRNPIIFLEKDGQGGGSEVPESIGDQKTIVFLLKNTAEEAEPFTVEQAKELVFNGGMQKLMKEQSYEKTFFSGDVYGWIDFPQASQFCTFPDSDLIGAYITQQGINLNNYDRIVYLNKGAGGGCSVVGKSQFTFNNQSYNISMATVGLAGHDYQQGNFSFPWTSFDFVLSHELGHSLGVAHANGWDCGEMINEGNCNHYEYGNLFDTMGHGHLSLHFNAFYKELLGWIPPEKIVSISQSGTYTLNPLEIDSEKIAAKVNASGTSLTPYYLEWRKGIGFDSYLNHNKVKKNQLGIFVNKIIHADGEFPFPRVFDMHPTSVGWYDGDVEDQVTLNAQESFSDARYGISLDSVALVGTTSISFNVGINPVPCTRATPIITEVSTRPVSSNGYGFASFRITNNDSITCSSSAFKTNIIAPSGWSFSEVEDVTFDPDKSRWQYISFRPKDAAPGLYDVGIEVTNVTSGLKTVYTTKILITPPLTISRFDPDFGREGTTITIHGTGFNEVSNQVCILDLVGVACSNDVPSINGNTLQYTIPSTLRNCSTGEKECTDVPIVDGQYTISIQANYSYVSKEFTVGDAPFIYPSVVINNNPVLVMSYDSAGGESKLSGLFALSISAGSKDQILLKENAFFPYIVDSHGASFGGTQTLNTVSTNQDTINYYAIPAGTSRAFTLRAAFNPKILFAGTYEVVLDNMMLGDYTNPKYISINSRNRTNSLVIIGELSPYINSIDPFPVPANEILTVSGIRFAPEGNVVELRNQSAPGRTVIIASSTNNGQTLSFVPRVAAGDYSLQIIHPTTGESNVVSVKVSHAIVPPPTVKVLSPNGGENWKIGSTQEITFDTSATNVTHPIFLRRYIDNGSTTPRSDANLTVGSTALGAREFTYTLPALISTYPGIGNKYKIMICTDENCSIFDESDNYFSILSETGTTTPPVILSAPIQETQGIVTEVVTCKFGNSKVSERCFTLNPDRSPTDFGCSGKGSCTVEVKGPLRTQFNWRSSCSQENTLATPVTGRNKSINFPCPAI